MEYNMIKQETIPCVNCITYAICKSEGASLSSLLVKCILLERYLEGQNPVRDENNEPLSYDQTRVTNVLEFFKWGAYYDR